ncbi:MAG: LysM peptidoglycan-binding domain-containing protein [Actinomycetes bacterium]
MSQTLTRTTTRTTTRTPSGTPARPQPTSLRLTIRGRILVTVLLTLAVFALVSLGRVWAQADQAAQTDQAGPASPTGTRAAATVAHRWVVQPGETLWTVAQTVRPDVDPRETIARIVALNALPDTSVVAGQTLLVPA